MKEKPENPEVPANAGDHAGQEPEKKLSRRSMLAKLGLVGAAIYATPVLMTLSDAQARSRSRSRSGSRRRRRRRRRNRRSRSRSRSRG